MTKEQEQGIKRHGENLLRLFKHATESDPVTLCKKLRRLESLAHRAATDYCNGDIDETGMDKVKDTVLRRLDKLLNYRIELVPVFINRDPRGYALKIEDDFTSNWVTRGGGRIHRDWGGYGIIAPEIGKDGR